MKFPAAFAAQPKWLILSEMTLAVLLIGLADYFTGRGISFFVVYGIPIFIVAWLTGRGAAFGIALLACFLWFFANLFDYPELTKTQYAWATTNRLLYFGFVAAGGAAMRQEREVGRERIRALAVAREHEMEVVRAGEREQIRIGQDLHDGVCQSLAAIDCATACLREELEAAGLPQAALAGKIQQFLQETIVEARNLARGIVPVQVERDGMVSALNELVTKANLVRDGSTYFESSGDIQIGDRQVALHLYRIAQEAMSNAARHANATQLAVRLCQENSTLVLEIADDGKGFASDENSLEGLGLRTMRYRAQLIGAKLSIISEPGRGTTVRCLLPQHVADSSQDLISHLP